MAVIVQKYGGTSVADPARIRAVADRVRDVRAAGNEVVAVVSAMGRTTDQLLALAADISSHSHPREMDMLLSAGERITMALLAMALNERGVPAVSYTGSQAGILTDSSHGRAKITKITGERVKESLAEGKAVIVAGFQGVDPRRREITTLGRGGSDATAVALAASLGADACEIFTDVDGVFTADPRAVPAAKMLDEVSYDDMLELAAGGAGVLMPRAVEFGRRFNVPIHVRSSFNDSQGTWVKERTMEQVIISGVAHDRSEAKVTVQGVPDRPGVAASVFGRLADAGVNVDMIVQNISRDGATDISFTVPRANVAEAERLSREAADEVGARSVDVDGEVGKVSIIGAGMKTNPGVAAGTFKALSDAGINIEMISTSTIRISCVVRADQLEAAVRALHEAFDPPTLAEESGT